MSDKPKRVTNRVQPDASDYRNMAALVAGELRVGTVQGVHVDFRHPQLPAGEWEAAVWWYVWPNAGIVFPEEAKFGMERLREEKLAPDDPAVFALVGDRISIERVEIEPGDNRFDHEHDRERRLAFLRIDRPTGETVRPDHPLAFYGVGRILKQGTREAFDHILERITRHAGTRSLPPYYLHQLPHPLWDQPLEHLALGFAEDAHRHFFKLLDTLPADGEGNGERAALRMAINNAALAGFLLGKVERRELEDRAERQSENARLAAEARKDRNLLKRAATLAAEHPQWKRNQIAKELLKDFPEKEQSSINRTLKREGIGPDRA